MNLSNIFTKKNLEIIDLISKEELSIRDIADKLRCSPGKVHSAVILFDKNSLIKKNKIKNRIIIKPNINNPLYQKIKSLTNLHSILDSTAYKRLNKLGTMGIYGSFAQGTDTNDSDVDLWVFTDKKEMEIREIIRSLEGNIQKKVSLLILNKIKLSNLKNKDSEFYIRLKLTSIQLNGDIFE